MNSTNKQITTLLCSLAFLFCFADGLSAQRINLRMYPSGSWAYGVDGRAMVRPGTEIPHGLVEMKGIVPPPPTGRWKERYPNWLLQYRDKYTGSQTAELSKIVPATLTAMAKHLAKLPVNEDVKFKAQLQLEGEDDPFEAYVHGIDGNYVTIRQGKGGALERRLLSKLTPESLMFLVVKLSGKKEAEKVKPQLYEENIGMGLGEDEEDDIGMGLGEDGDEEDGIEARPAKGKANAQEKAKQERKKSAEAAIKIAAKTKNGFISNIEILGVVGDSLQYKNSEGAAKLIPLSEFDEETLIRIIKELGKLKKTTPSSTPAQKPSAGKT